MGVAAVSLLVSVTSWKRFLSNLALQLALGVLAVWLSRKNCPAVWVVIACCAIAGVVAAGLSTKDLIDTKK